MVAAVSITALVLLVYVATLLRKMSDNFAKWANADLKLRTGYKCK